MLTHIRILFNAVSFNLSALAYLQCSSSKLTTPARRWLLIPRCMELYTFLGANEKGVGWEWGDGVVRMYEHQTINPFKPAPWIRR